jgi:hypothetical protein
VAARRRDRTAERVAAAAYGTVLVLAALVVIDADDVSSGLGWEVATGVGVATWLAHLYAEVIGDHVRSDTLLDRRELNRAMVDGAPILLATVGPAVALLLGRLDVLSGATAQWVAVCVAIVQLVGLGAFVGATVSPGGRSWSYGAVTGLAGVVVVVLKLSLGH